MPRPVVSSETTKRSAMSVAEMVEVERRDRVAMVWEATQALSSTVPRPLMRMEERDWEVGGGADGVGDVGWDGVDVGGEKDFGSRFSGEGGVVGGVFAWVRGSVDVVSLFVLCGRDRLGCDGEVVCF